VTWVITRLCRDCVDMICLDVCPVDCIVERAAGPTAEWPNQLYIVPNECIDCGACEPECPWEAIFEEPAVPPELAEDITLNARVQEQRDGFVVPDRPKIGGLTTRAERDENRAKWGLGPA
jgi:ferredoxin